MNDESEYTSVLMGLKGIFAAEVAAAASGKNTVESRIKPRLHISGIPLLIGALILAGVVVVKADILASPTTAPQVAAAPQSIQPSEGIPTPQPVSTDASLTPTTPTATSHPSADVSGFPTTIDGEVVFSGNAAFRRATSVDPEPFLIAGWIVSVTVDCYNTCGSGLALAISGPRPLGPIIALTSNVGPTELPAGGRAVLQVHHDPGAAGCPTAETCAPSVVVDATVWTAP